ncbi:hypothetical protein Pyn_27491 [Prunus yedoensis var. nudiflora]|uniref:Uncharacterized protein n=1 Tax=Prunus yedoensis var. nudiflora TaxID=2094558 RepID=A0A314YJD6_PRUYE|nr:hypothetical protein Pyn_27491 [Prunus yedoensis var. nudiflora]
MGRRPCCDKEGIKKGAWTAQEDEILSNYINTYGKGKWRHLPQRVVDSVSRAIVAIGEFPSL